MNPALQGIDPPITPEQGSQIANVADTIGTDKDKNGWAIAIAQFKKNHKVVDGHWVEKDKKEMSMDDTDNVEEVVIIVDPEDVDDNNTDDLDDDLDELDFAAKDDWGTGDAITVDKSKDSMSNTVWGSVDKTALMHAVLKAKNYKSLVNDVYMVVDSDWDQHPSSSLHFPVMQIIGGKAVYNKGGLSAALQRASGKTALVSKISAIQSKMGTKTDSDNEGKEKMSMEDEKDLKDKKDEKQEDMAVDKKEKEETPAEEKKETPAEEKKEEEKGTEKKMSAKMSLDAYLDVEAMLAFLEDETESYQELVSEFEKEPGQCDWGKVMAFCYGKFCKMDADNKTYMKENMSLKDFKASIEKQEYEFAVNTTISEIKNTVEIPADDVNKLLDESKKYSLSTVDAWKNFAKATAFNFAKREKTPDDTERKIGLYWQNLGNKTQTGTVWDRLK
jgi:hypothetical protein